MVLVVLKLDSGAGPHANVMVLVLIGLVVLKADAGAGPDTNVMVLTMMLLVLM